MPSYDYQCPVCGATAVRVLRIDQRDIDAPWCDKDACLVRMQRQPAAPSIQFKGAGWTPKHYGGK